MRNYYSLLPNKQFYDIAIGIADVHLHDTITARTWPPHDCHIMSLQALASFFQVCDLEGKMRNMTNGEFFGAVSSRLQLGGTSRLRFADQVDLGTTLTKPGPGEVE